MSAIAPEITGLAAGQPLRLPFGSGLDARQFRLERPEGDLLIYAAGEQDDPAPAATRRYLNHWHEAMFLPPGRGAPIFVHADDRAEVESYGHVRATFSRRHHLGDDFEAIPTPGHTPGATAYVWEHGDHRFLFTGDTIYLGEGGEWVDGLLESSDRAAFVRSLELIRGLDFDVLVPWVAGAGDPWFSVTTPAETKRRIDRLLARIRVP